MTTEEKAKAYDEALKKARELYNEAKEREFSTSMSIYEEIFPQLRESEDERIRRKMLEHFRNKTKETWCNIPVKDIIAYLEKQKDLTTENIYKHSRERMSFWNGQQKEQKPAESISQLTVQGKGVYKICPRCKERMIRDNTKVYTSMPPQYGYKCPKCGETEFDTAMYDNPDQDTELTYFESALFTAFSYAWQSYLRGEEVNVAQWAKENSAELLEAARFQQEQKEQKDFQAKVEQRMEYLWDKLPDAHRVEESNCTPEEWKALGAYMELEMNFDKGSEEKQKEQKPLKVGENAYFDPNTEMWFIKEEQKPADLSEMMVHKEPYIAPVPTPMVADEQKPIDYDAELEKCKHNYLYFWDKYVTVKLKPAKWSDEDEEMLQSIIKDFRDGNISSIGQEQWLKSLPERFNLQPKQEWSKEDEMYLSQAIETLEHENYFSLAERLKSLCPQPKRDCKDCAMFLNGKCTKPYWKPSKEELNLLQYLAKGIDVASHERHVLDNMIDKLTRL